MIAIRRVPRHIDYRLMNLGSMTNSQAAKKPHERYFDRLNNQFARKRRSQSQHKSLEDLCLCFNGGFSAYFGMVRQAHHGCSVQVARRPLLMLKIIFMQL